MATDGASAIREAFAKASGERRAALIPYAVAGYPDVPTAHRVALALVDAGADLLEIGLPYSDPLADGLTLQRASGQALRNGQTLERSIEMVARVHADRPDVPLVAMGYVNQVIGGGDADSALRKLAAAGASGLILADLTPDEGADVESAAAAHGLSIIYLVTPTTPPARRRMIAERSTGFLYAVSLAGVTGARKSLPAGIGRFLKEVGAVSPVPVAVGFGVSRPEHARRLAPLADGVIVASALVDALGPDGGDVERMSALAAALRAATQR
ncbi:MAG: tryptophan synthase alpha chain [Chloroflexota bacterium]|jgi:tryptophan synthase alpha chain|nr:tryptophan synthase alpha chain [Chloroflexota bacterium]